MKIRTAPGDFLKALMLGDLTAVKACVEKHPHYLHEPLQGRELFAIQIAAGNGHFELVSLLMAQPCKVPKNTLCWAVIGKDIEIVRRLFSGNPNTDPNQSIDSMTTLHIAAKNNDIPMIDLLISLGASLHSKSKQGHTPLKVAQLFSQWDAARHIERLLLAEKEQSELTQIALQASQKAAQDLAKSPHQHRQKQDHKRSSQRNRKTL